MIARPGSFFPDWPTNNLKEYADWFVKTAATKYSLPTFLVEPMRAVPSSKSTPPPTNVLSKLKHSQGGVLLVEWMNSMVAPPNESFKLPLTQFAYYLAQLEEDLASRFALSKPEQWQAYSRWFVEKTAQQYNLPAQFIQPVKLQLDIVDFEQKLTPFERLLLNLLNSSVDGSGHEPLLTVAAYRCYDTRPDLRAAFPIPLDQDRSSYASWFANSAIKQMELHPALVAPVRNSLHLAVSSPAAWPTDFLGQLGKSLGGRQLITWLNQEYQPNESGQARISRLAYYLYSTDEEAQRQFRAPLGNDRDAMAHWFVTVAATKYNIPALFLEPVKGSLGFSADAGSETELVSRSRTLSARRRFNLDFITARRSVVTTTFSGYFPASSNGESKAPARPADAGQSHRRADHDFGLNIVGYLSAPTGVGEAARRMIAAAQVGNIPFSTKNLVEEGLSHNEYAQAYVQTRQTTPYGINLLQVNADQLPEVTRTLGPLVHDRYNIGYWYWEISNFPDRYQPAFGHINEVWVASSFVQQAIAYKSSVPVVRIPPAISPVVAPGVSRAKFGLPTDRFLFLTMFDIMSVYERKNPFAVVEAFERAFKNNYDGVGLVLKVSNAAKNEAEIRALRDRLARLPAYLVEDYLDQSEVNALTASADCTVSLHRAEGFGLTLAEAMYLGKPVIATAYSGNMDFTNASNSLLVDYELVELKQAHGPYPAGSQWADPDIEQAAHHMRQLVEDRPLAERLAHKGQRFIWANYSPEAVSELIRQRCMLIEKVNT